MNSSVTYFSTNRKVSGAGFREALLQGLAADGGLFMPDRIPRLTDSTLQGMREMPYAQIAFEVLHTFLGEELPVPILKRICDSAYTFPVPLEKVAENSFVMRLDQGPTASFKDFAARLMGQLMQHYLAEEGKNIVILTATSGDTGSAVANAFYGLGNIRVIVLFPANEVTPMQRKQMTTLHRNIQVIAVNGKFDDCQAMVKQAFADETLRHIPLSSANSINIGRLLPQSVFYFYAWAKLARKSSEKIIFSVPSGNFGDLMGGLIAREMGLPVEKFIIGTNENNEVPEYLRTGEYRVLSPSRNCISSAMNVGHPSNMARIVSLYGGSMNEQGVILASPDFQRIQNDFYAVSISDAETRDAIARAYRDYKLLLEPHGAVAWESLQRYLQSRKDNPSLCVALETAHPAKFPAEIRDILGIEPQLPESLAGLDNKTEDYLPLNNSYAAFRDYLKNHY